MKKGLALRDITNQTPHPKTLKKTVKKPVPNTLKKTAKKPETSLKSQAVLKSKTENSDLEINVKETDSKENDIEYMPPRAKNPIEYTNDLYKLDLSCIKPTSRGCTFTKFKILPDEFEQEEIVFKVDDDLIVEDVDDGFLYF